MANARKELSGFVKFSEGLKNVGTSLTQYVTAPLALFSGAAVAASGKIESLKKGIEAITLQELGKQGVTGLAALRAASEQTTARMAELEQVAKRPGLGFEGAVQGDVRLRAVGISAEQSAKSIAAFANAIATTGGGKSEFDRVTVQLAQLSAKGKVLAQDLRPIIEAAPAVSGALQRLYGTVDSETISASLAKQGKSSTDFIAVLTDELAKLPQVSGGLKNAFENLADTGTLALAKFGDGISKALNLPGVLAGLSSFVERAANAFAALTPGTQTLIVALGGIAAAVGPVLVAVGTLGAALPALTAGFQVLGVSSLAALGPILPAALAVGAAAFVVYENWDALTAYFSSGPGATLFSDLASAAGSAASAIGEAFGNVRASVGTSMGDLLAAVGPVLGVTLKQIVVSLTGALNVLAGSITAISGVLTGDFSQAANGASQAFYGLIDPLASLLGFTVRVQEANPILVLSRHATEFNAVFPQLRANLDALNSVQLGALASQAGEAAKQIGLLKKLEDELKAAKEAKPNLTTEAEIAASNQLIASLEAQIKRLNELGIASKEMQKAYAEVQKSLRTVANESLALGDQYNYLQSRQSATESGIKKLIAAGFSPASSAVRTLVADLRNLNATFLGASETLDLRKLKGADKLFETPEFKLKLPDNLGLPTQLKPIDVTPFTASLGEATTAMVQAQKVGEEISQNFGEVIKQGLANTAVGLGEAFGGIINGMQGFNDIGAVLLSGIADVMIQLGKLAIGAGIAVSGIKAALESLNPVAAIVGGIALVALGSAIKGSAKSLSTSAGGSGASAISTSPASRPSSFNPTTAPTAAAAPATYTHYIEITASGRDLKGVLALETDRFGRVVGVH